MRRRLNRWVPLPAVIMLLLVLLPSSFAQASPVQTPTYPNLESFSFKSSPPEIYAGSKFGAVVPDYYFPALQDLRGGSLSHHVPLYFTDGSFKLSGETGPQGNVTGTFSYSGYGEISYADGGLDTYQVSVQGQITNAKAAFDENGYLRVMGAAHYQRQFEHSGTATMTMTYNSRAYNDDHELEAVSGTVSGQGKLAFVSCISNLDDINLCYFSAGKAYGDYGFEAAFVNDAKYQFVWHNNLDYEFGLIGDIDFDPEAHHHQTEEEPVPEEDVYQDESYLDEPVEAEDLPDDPNAGFSVALSCSDQVYPQDNLNCNMNVVGGTEYQTYLVNWIMDGYVIKSSTILLGQDNFTFPYPPPGSHVVQVQVMDDSTYNLRVASTGAEILVPPDDGRLPPWTQATAAAGSVLILGAWLWSEWAAARVQSDWMEKFQDRVDEMLGLQRAQWYEQQMVRNDEVKARVQVQDDYQAACEKEWGRFRGELMKTIDQHHQSDYLIDLYDDMLSDVQRGGRWDGKALVRLEELINTHLKMDRQAEAQAEWKRKLDFLNERQKAFSETTGGWTAMGVELLAGALTGGASEMVFMPTRAIGNALYASKRAELLGKTGWEAAKSVMVESGVRLGTDYVFSKAGEKVVGKLFEAGGKGLKRVIGQEGMDTAAEWWQRTAAKIGGPPKLDSDLPVIRQTWGKGPQVFVNKPIFKPGKMPPVDLGMENYLNNRVRPISGELAEDMGRMFREGVEVDPHMNNLLKPGGRFNVTQADDAAVRLLNNPAYKQAVREGVVPASLQQAVYQTRDKICKNAINETFKRLDDVLIGGKPASSYIQSVAVTGTGAKPLSPQAVGRFTDFDATAIASGSTPAAREAEQVFSKTFTEIVEESGMRTGTAEVNMFSGVRANPLNPPRGGYGSEPLIHWQKVDMINRGRSAVRTTDGGVLFDAHPDLAPIEGFGPMEAVPRFPVQPEAAVSDAGRVVVNHVNDAVTESGRQMTRDAILRQEGKHALRVWKTIHAGRGASPPSWIQKLEGIKRDPTSSLSAREVDSLWRQYSEYLDLPEDLGV